MSDVVRWGVLSTLPSAPQALIPGLAAAEGSRVRSGLRHASEERAAAAAARWGWPGYASYYELLDDPEIDSVYVPLPNHRSDVDRQGPGAGSTSSARSRWRSRCTRSMHRGGLGPHGCLVLERSCTGHARRWERAAELVSGRSGGGSAGGAHRLLLMNSDRPWSPLFDPDLGWGHHLGHGCYAAAWRRRSGR